MNARNRRAGALSLLAAFGLVGLTGARPAPAPTPPLRAVLVGGGPSREYNQVGIESNVRYLRRLLPPPARVRTLFADGDPRTRDVQYLDDRGRERYRASSLTNLDGPSRLASLDKAFGQLRQGHDPVLLYFTGHGSPDRAGDYADNAYDLWNEEDLPVRRLSSYLDTLPADTPVTLVMVQCFSGAFGNLLFENGGAQGAPKPRDLCGFFASLPSREAAGCTPEVNEADYHDFTSYFFAALSGQDRLGRASSGADYDHDGRVGMNEAFDYTLLHDVSIDTPVCTSDVFLRRYVTTSNEDVFRIPYSQARAWASPGQQAVLDGLSAQLGVAGEGRLATAYARVTQRVGRARRDDTDTAEERTALWIRLVRMGKSVVLAHTLQASSDAALKTRYETLKAAEARNPIRPQ